MIFEKGQAIGEYTVAFPIKEGAYAETYRVKSPDGKNCFLKLFNYAKLHRTQFDSEGNVLELEICKLLKHPNLTSLLANGELIKDGKRYAYLVFAFISGETAAERVGREQGCTVKEALRIVNGVLDGLKFLHSLPNPVIHNELTIQNVMLDLSSRNPKPVIIDFGYARFLNQSQHSFQKQGLNPFYVAPEAMNGIFTVQSDIFSVGAMLYHLLYGLPPYFVDASRFKNDDRGLEEIIAQERERPLKILAKEGPKTEDGLINVIAKALAVNVDQRFQNVDEFQKALNGEIHVNAPVPPQKWDIGQSSEERPVGKSRENSESSKVDVLKGNGFADVAGMKELKEQLQSDVIDVLNEPERAKKFGLHLPNGILFYGPPGCGKSYFAEKLAEQVGCSFISAHCSDVASPYIHGGQEKIAALFEQAHKNKPCIVFLDEIEVMLRDRNMHDNASMAGEVNEFLVQLNNCGKDGVMVIGATNEPNLIDKAALRSGRLEYKYFIPLPDDEMRKEMFQIHLRGKDVDQNIDYEHLSKITDGFTSSDIQLIVEKAGRIGFRNKEEVLKMDSLVEAVNQTKSSVSPELRSRYDAIKAQFEGERISTDRKKIGF